MSGKCDVSENLYSEKIMKTLKQLNLVLQNEMKNGSKTQAKLTNNDNIESV